MTEPHDLRQFADEMRRTADGIRRTVSDAAASVHQASSPGEEVVVEADGRPRVRAVHIAPRTMGLETAALTQLLVETLNAGLTAARAGSAAEMLGNLDPATASAVRSAAAEAGRLADGAGSPR